MEVSMAMLADSARHTEQSKVDIAGLFEKLYLDRFPSVHPRMYLVLRFSAHETEIGVEQEVGIKLEDPHGELMAALRGVFGVSEESDAIGRKRHAWQILELPDTRFPAPGEYRFVITIGGETLRTLPLQVERSGPDLG